MRTMKRKMYLGCITVALGFVCCAQMGCSGLTPPENMALGTVAATVVGARSPSHEIEQIYYLGVFDPQEQVPPAVYRVRVHGQASFISRTHFASGWVRADLIDTLGTGIEFDKKDGSISIKKGNDDLVSSMQTGRKLILFGPEGFREAPKDHRLVIVMGSSPEAFFNAMDESVSVVSKVMEEQGNTKLSQMLFEALAKIKGERERLTDIKNDVNADLPARKETKS